MIVTTVDGRKALTLIFGPVKGMRSQHFCSARYGYHSRVPSRHTGLTATELSEIKAAVVFLPQAMNSMMRDKSTATAAQDSL